MNQPIPAGDPLSRALRQAARWNARNPVGTPVIVRLKGEVLETRTSTTATVVFGFALVGVEGLDGGCWLPRVRRSKETSACASATS